MFAIIFNILRTFVNVVKHLFYIIIVTGCISVVTQCREDKLLIDTSAKLDFSEDTIIFDTVFTTVGTTTQHLKLYNNNKGDIEISSISLAGGSSSPFRINVDGISGIEHENILIEKRDSLFIFIEATLKFNNANNPLVIEDSIIFVTNGNVQSVKLVAWGQDAYFHVNEIVEGTWDNDKPHVIYGIAAVGFPGLDSNLTLNIPAATRVHVHANSLLYVYKSTLNIFGMEGSEVIFEGDRLESYYEDKPGQWNGIWLIHSENSMIHHTIIKNGERGLYVYKTNPGSSSPALTLNNTKCSNNAFSGIWADESYVKSTNNLFADNGSYCGVFVNGGQYEFNHCTFGNYYTEGTRTTPAFLLNNYYQIPNTTTYVGFDINLTIFENCIMYGSLANEFVVDTIPGFTQDFIFNSCNVRSDETVTTNPQFYQNIQKNINPLFIDPTEGDFDIKAASPVIDQANSNSPGIDIDNRPRSGIGDLGAYEYQ